MADLSTIDVGSGCTLIFQKNVVGDVRAVIKNDKGEIVARGPVAPEREAKRSQFAAVMAWQKSKIDVANTVPTWGSLGDKEEEEDEDEEDEEEE